MIIMLLSQDIREMSGSIYVPRGVNVKSLSVEALWPFVPVKSFKVSSNIFYINLIIHRDTGLLKATCALTVISGEVLIVFLGLTSS